MKDFVKKHPVATVVGVGAAAGLVAYGLHRYGGELQNVVDDLATFLLDPRERIFHGYRKTAIDETRTGEIPYFV